MPLSICKNLTAEQRKLNKMLIQFKLCCEKLWIYPVRTNDPTPKRAQYWYPAIWCSATFSIDDLYFSMMYEFKYLDSAAKGRSPVEYVYSNVLWDKGINMIESNTKISTHNTKR